MHPFILKYYSEEIYPHQFQIYSDTLYNENVRLQEECLSLLQSHLNPDDLAVLDDFRDCQKAILDTISERNFYLGTRFGLSVLMDCGDLTLAD